MSRSQKQPILYQDKLNVPEKYLRFATPAVVADYRADKLKCKKLVEIGAGIGGQTLAFSKICKEVLAIESNKESAKILIQNLKKLKIENVEVIVVDALSKKAIEEIKKFQPDIIFCDTERPEKGERTIEKIKPPIKKLLENFSEITSKIAIEIPPFTDTENLKYNFEKEFISVNQQLNRLTLYFNELKKSDVSAISLPSKEKISGDSSNKKQLSRGGASDFAELRTGIKKRGRELGGNDYLYVIDPTIIVAGLISELSGKFDSKILELNKPVLLSDKKINSNFLTGYKILAICKNEQKDILQNLKKIDAGKIVLRYNILPQDYWKIRNSYEKELNGKREISLFIDDKNNEAILCEKI
jgi:hypothetical protein